MFFRKTPFDENDLQSIIAACLSGSQSAQKALIKFFLTYARHICLPYVASKEEAEEVVNDCFLKVFTHLNKYDHTRPFKAWFKSILINTAIDYYRKNAKSRYHVEVDDSLQLQDESDVISKMSADEILALVQKLPVSYRLVFNLYVLEGYTHREIAEMLGIKEGTSKSNLQDARRKLQAMIAESHPHLFLAYSLKTSRFNEN
jgi:RNA polymerase sigma-70 factor (ECF subfamily)